jgi:hypothetical protein
MNEQLEQIERRLRRQPLRQVPAEWREEILAAAVVGQPSPAARRSFLSTRDFQLSTIFWPHPVAWAGLAAVWIFIFAVDFSTRDRTPVIAANNLPPPAEVMAEVHLQQQLLVELLGPRETRDADRQRNFVPKPRSEHMEMANV